MRLRALDEGCAAEFRDLLARANPEAARCLCTSAYVEAWRDPSLATPCRERMFRDGVSDGFLFYEGTSAIGWCQAAPRDTLANLVRGRGLAADASVWAVSCLVLAPEAKGRGLSHEMLRLVIAELRGRGVARVEVFACRYGPDEDTSAFVELPESLCTRAGMALVQDHAMRPLYGLPLA